MAERQYIDTDNVERFDIFANGKTHVVYAVNQYAAIAQLKRRDGVRKEDIIYVRRARTGKNVKFEEPYIKFMGIEYPI